MGLTRAALVFIFSLTVVLSVMALLLRLLENSLTFHPRRNFEFHPEEFGLEHREVTLRVGDGDSLHGWYFPPADSDSPVLLIFHGNAGNISHRLEWIAPFVRRGLGALLFDYRGYGLSSGKPGERAFQEDALAAWDYLAVDCRLEPTRIVAFGRSIGAAPAVFLAARRQLGAVILEGAFTSGQDMARRIFGLLPVHLVMKNRWEVEKPLAGLALPVLIIHGRQDEVVPFALGERLAKATAPGSRIWWPVEGGGHLDLHFTLGKEYYERLERFSRNPHAGGV